MSIFKHKLINYRRKRDYSKHRNWTYELNKDLYKCYTKAREVPPKRLYGKNEKMRHKFHPELNDFTEKYLRQQATYIEK